MADYVLSAKGTYDGSNMDGGLDKSASKLSGLKDTAKSVGSQVAGFFATSFGSVGKSIATAIGTVTAGVTTLAATGGMSRALNIEKAQAMGLDVAEGDFAENVTTEGICLYELPVGTRFRVGDVEFEVTQIGKECHKGCAIQQKVGKCIMPTQGIFTKVIKEGTIHIGDTISVL